MKSKEAEKVKLLLFANFLVPPEKAKKIIEDMEKRPEKIPYFSKLLQEMMEKQFDTIKEKPLEEINKMASERVGEWTSKVGSITTEEFVSMSKQWDIPIDAFYDKKITPGTIKEMLDFFVMGQNEYKVRLAVSFFIYLMANKHSGTLFPKSSLLVRGPSGCGKTYGIQVLTKLFHVPFVTIHCNSLVQEGIVGPCTTDGFTTLMTQGWTEKEIEHAVVCFDEFDKLFQKQGGGDAGYYNARIVNEMLNIIDDNGEVEFKTSFERNNDKRIKVPTRKMMFVFTGVFDGLEEPDSIQGLLAKDKKRKAIGFMTSDEAVEELKDIVLGKEPSEAFVEFGVKPEIVGRICNYVFLNALTEEQLAALFNLGTSSPFNEYQQYFQTIGIDAVLTDEGKQTLAKIACDKNLGVRGLKSLLQQVLLEDMYNPKIGDKQTLEIDKQYIIEHLKGRSYG